MSTNQNPKQLRRLNLQETIALSQWMMKNAVLVKQRTDAEIAEKAAEELKFSLTAHNIAGQRSILFPTAAGPSLRTRKLELLEERVAALEKIVKTLVPPLELKA